MSRKIEDFAEISFRKELGGRLKEVRERAGCSQVQFAERIQLTQPTVVRYEAGDRAPDAYLLMRIAKEFGADLNWLILGDKGKPSKV